MNPGPETAGGTVAAGEKDGTAEVLLHGEGVSPGRAAGVAVRAGPPSGTPAPAAARGVEAERARLEAARQAAREQLERLASEVAGRAGENEAKIFSAQARMLDDPAFLTPAFQAIGESCTAEAAIEAAVIALSQKFLAARSDYLRARSADIRDIGQRLIDNLGDRASLPDRNGGDGHGVVLVAGEPLPSDIAGRDPATLQAVVAEQGSASSHAAILCRGLGIPAVFGVPNALEMIRAGDTVAVDGDAGEVRIVPAGSTAAATILARRAAQSRPIHGDSEPACTLDGIEIEVSANVAGAPEAATAAAWGADGIGLFRTEFLYLARGGDVPEDEQFACYRKLLEAFPRGRVTVRLLDAGGDKEMAWLGLPRDRNPFLGVRGIRLLSTHRHLFRTQIRALLRSARYGNLAIMVPMVSSIEEVRSVREVYSEVKDDLERGEGADAVPLGIMIETPAAALMADALAPEVDFFSIGTNDLTQYVLAVDRMNPHVAPMFQPLHPAVLRLVAGVAKAAARHHKTICMCGEAAANVTAAPLWLGLGVRALSVQPAAIPAVKRSIRGVRLADAVRLAHTALGMSTAAEVARLMEIAVPCNPGQ